MAAEEGVVLDPALVEALRDNTSAELGQYAAEIVCEPEDSAIPRVGRAIADLIDSERDDGLDPQQAAVVYKVAAALAERVGATISLPVEAL